MLVCSQGAVKKSKSAANSSDLTGTASVDVVDVEAGGAVIPGKGKKRKSSRLDPEVAAQLMALFGDEDGEDGELTGLDSGDKVNSMENVGLIKALRDRRAAGGVSSSPVSRPVAAFSTAASATVSSSPVSSIASLLGLAPGGSGLQGVAFIDSLPPAQLLTVGGMFCPSLQSAGTLLTLTKEKCLQPSPQFESPEELSANVTRIVMLLMQSESKVAREMGMSMAAEARRVFGSGRFKSFTVRDMVKLQRRVLMLVLEDPATAAVSFAQMMREAKLEKAFDKAWEYQVENDYLLDDDSDLTPARRKKQRGQDQSQDDAGRHDKTLCHNCGNVGHIARACSDPGNPDKVAAEKKKRQQKGGKKK